MARIWILICFAFPMAAMAEPTTETADAMLADYFARETQILADRCLADIESADDWTSQQEQLRKQLRAMLGLDPLPKRTDLKLCVTGEVEHKGVVVRKLHFQSRPGLYVTANLYLPKEISKPLPAVLYVCGHGRVVIDGVAYGSKAFYQHHPAWFAQNGYVCLTIDTLQLGEIQGLHHGTYREGMWWWINRGYTPAGVEAWNCVRAIDLLQSLEEVDGSRIGITGRSGGGAYSWWTAAIDERVKCAVPVAGITDLENYIVDGCVEGHCDCMFMVNTYRWDYPMVAALVAPRPLLISNTDSDPIFPLDGVFRTYNKVKALYQALESPDNVALHITAGPHSDTQELRVHAFRWMNQHLKDDKTSSVLPAEKFFGPKDLKVFAELPTDERNTQIQESFVEPAKTELPRSVAEWRENDANWRKGLRAQVFGGWPSEPSALKVADVFEASVDGLTLRAVEFDSQPHVRLRMLVAQPEGVVSSMPTELHVLNNQQWDALLAKLGPAYGHRLGVDVQDYDEQGFLTWARSLRADGTIRAYLAPRGVGPTRWDASPKKQIQIRRRFYLLGQTLDGMRVYDVRRALRTLQAESVSLHGSGVMAGLAVYASLFEPTVTSLKLDRLPVTHRDGPIFLNVRRYLDMPQALAMAAAKIGVRITGDEREFVYATKTMKLLGKQDSLKIARPPAVAKQVAPSN